MKSGLEGRNNLPKHVASQHGRNVSMKSGLEGRNNGGMAVHRLRARGDVSMKSGLEGRNNVAVTVTWMAAWCLNEVRPRRPEQFPSETRPSPPAYSRLNEVRPRRPEQSHRDCLGRKP